MPRSVRTGSVTGQGRLARVVAQIRFPVSIVLAAWSGAPCLAGEALTPDSNDPAQTERLPVANDLEASAPFEPAPDKGMAHASGYWENDGSHAKPWGNSDQYYTNGIRLELTLAPFETTGLAARLGEALGHSDPRSAYGLRVTHLMHTPEDITFAEPQPDDHPWSGHVGIAGFVQLAEDAGASSGGVARMDHLGVEIGWVGERAGAAGLQEFVHESLANQESPEGWSNQLTNELTFSVRWERRWRLLAGVIGDDADRDQSPSQTRGLGWDVIPSVGIVAGTPRVYGQAGLGVRLGWNLPGDFGPARLDGFRDATWDTRRPASDAERGPWSLYGFAVLSGRAVAWDMFLEGNAAAPGPDGVDARALVGDVYAGAAVRYRWFELAWGFSFETDRFRGQSDAHSYGTIRFGASFSY